MRNICSALGTKFSSWLVAGGLSGFAVCHAVSSLVGVDGQYEAGKGDAELVLWEAIRGRIMRARDGQPAACDDGVKFPICFLQVVTMQKLSRFSCNPTRAQH